MTMVFEGSQGAKVNFGRLGQGDCFIDDDGDYCMKIQENKEGNAVVLFGADAGVVIQREPDWVLTRVSLIVRVGGV
jgi:hypothetical protein